MARAKRGSWIEVATLKFGDDESPSGALDLTSLKRLGAFQTAVTEVAKIAWHRRNPERKNLPKNYQDNTRLYLRRVVDGSTVLPLEYFVEAEHESQLFPLPAEALVPGEVLDAVGYAHIYLKCAEERNELPGDFPLETLEPLEKMIEDMTESKGTITFVPASLPQHIDIDTLALHPFWKSIDRAEVAINERTKAAALSYRSISAEDQIKNEPVSAVGEVRFVDLENRIFRFWLNDGSRVTVKDMKAEHEEAITKALNQHEYRRLKVAGYGIFGRRGALSEIVNVDSATLCEPFEHMFDDSQAPLSKFDLRESADILSDIWSSLPTDLSKRVDEYLYGEE